MSKVFRINKIDEKFTEEEIIEMIKTNVLNMNDLITTPDIKKWLKISDTIYEFYKEDTK